MKSVLIMMSLALLAGGAMAQSWSWYGGQMGIYFSDSDFTDENTNYNTTDEIFYFYIVLRDAQVTSVYGYECAFTATDPAVLFLGASGDNGWTNFGDVDNHLVGFQTPRLVDGNGDVVLSSVVAIYLVGDPVDLIMGPSSPSTGDPNSNIWGYSWDGPIIADGEDYEHLLCCHLTSGAADYPDVVATLNAVVVATEIRSWTQVKNLFE